MQEEMKKLTPEDTGWAEAFANNTAPLRKMVDGYFDQAQEAGTLEPQIKLARDLMEDPEFVNGLLELEEPEQVQAAFAAKGVEMSLDEVKAMGQIIERTIESGGELSEEDLEEISGGVVFMATLTTAVTIAQIILTGGSIVAKVAQNWRSIKRWFRRW